MTDEPIKETEVLSLEELAAQGGEQLPDHEAMSPTNANVAIPINAAVAANVLSGGVIAIADATEGADSDQNRQPEKG